jgi:hypothetical protein
MTEIPRFKKQIRVKILSHTAKRNVDLFSISPIMLLLASAELLVEEVSDEVSFFASRFINV